MHTFPGEFTASDDEHIGPNAFIEQIRKISQIVYKIDFNGKEINLLMERLKPAILEAT